MAETAPAVGRRRPRKDSANGDSEAKEPRAKALYHLYEEDDDGVTLHKLGDDPSKTYEGRNATEAIEAYIDDGHDAEGVTFVVIPDRNLARVKADVETKTKVKLSPA